MKYIHYQCLKNWLNSKIEEDITLNPENQQVEIISYNRNDIACELCKEVFPDYVKFRERYYNISFYEPKFEEFIVLESMRTDRYKAKFIHLISFDRKNSINIGRANECELSIAEQTVSRFHCIIHKKEGDLFIEDNCSKFGTLILIQNHNMIMNDHIPLQVQLQKIFFKFKISLPFKFSCCNDPHTEDFQKSDYQIQNRKCFDILSYFIIKENSPNQEVDKEEMNEKENDKNNENSLIDDDNKDRNESESHKGLIDEKSMDKINKDSDNKSDFELIQKNQTHKIKKIKLKKGKNEGKELPHSDIINTQHQRENNPLIGEKDANSSASKENGSLTKTINLIRLNNCEGKYNKTNINNNLGNSRNNIGVRASCQTVKNDDNKIK